MDTLYSFLKQEYLHPDSFDTHTEITKLINDMRAGLAGETSSAFMLPTFISPNVTDIKDETVIVLDAGGTNLRVGAVTFKDGKAFSLEFEKHPLPGSGEKLTCTEFFDGIAQKLAPYLDRGRRIGFCFSYAAECTEDKDGRIIGFCKEVRVTGAEGAFICRELENAIRRMGITRDYSFVQLNDTVATMLGGMAVCDRTGYDGFIGCILGTGTNTCYIEQTKNITKYRGSGYTDEAMVVNIESGCYSGFPKGSIDRELDAASAIPGDHQTEKLISGVYMGKIIAAALSKAEKAGFVKGVPQLNEIPMPDVNGFLAGESSVLDSIEGRSNAESIILSLYGRTARILAVTFAAIALMTDKGKNKPICIVMEGSTYHRSPSLQQLLKEELDKIWQSCGLAFEIISTDNATLTGSAFASVSNT